MRAIYCVTGTGRTSPLHNRDRPGLRSHALSFYSVVQGDLWRDSAPVSLKGAGRESEASACSNQFVDHRRLHGSGLFQRRKLQRYLRRNWMLSAISLRNSNGQYSRRPWREVFVWSRLRGSDDDSLCDCIFCIWQGGPLLLFAELHAHPIASPWERNVVPLAQIWLGQRPIIQTVLNGVVQTLSCRSVRLILICFPNNGPSGRKSQIRSVKNSRAEAKWACS